MANGGTMQGELGWGGRGRLEIAQERKVRKWL